MPSPFANVTVEEGYFQVQTGVVAKINSHTKYTNIQDFSSATVIGIGPGSSFSGPLNSDTTLVISGYSGIKMTQGLGGGVGANIQIGNDAIAPGVAAGIVYVNGAVVSLFGSTYIYHLGGNFTSDIESETYNNGGNRNIQVQGNYTNSVSGTILISGKASAEIISDNESKLSAGGFSLAVNGTYCDVVCNQFRVLSLDTQDMIATAGNILIQNGGNSSNRITLTGALGSPVSVNGALFLNSIPQHSYYGKRAGLITSSAAGVNNWRALIQGITTVLRSTDADIASDVLTLSSAGLYKVSCTFKMGLDTTRAANSTLSFYMTYNHFGAGTDTVELVDEICGPAAKIFNASYFFTGVAGDTLSWYADQGNVANVPFGTSETNHFLTLEVLRIG